MCIYKYMNVCVYVCTHTCTTGMNRMYVDVVVTFAIFIFTCPDFRDFLSDQFRIAIDF